MDPIAESASVPLVCAAVSQGHIDSPPSSPQNPIKMSTDSASGLRSRTLILCFDGTASQYDGENTNVVKFYSLLRKDITEEQLCYYQPGIGTYIEPGVVSPLFSWIAKIADEAVAWYLDAHVRGGYQFLMQNWRPNDKICIFGFSRGAYTARALAGLVHKIGLLPKDNPEQVPMAYKLFKRTDPESIQLAAGYKQTFCRSVTIEFVGVWDTVASVGVLTSKTLPFTTSNTTIKVFRHALSLDEHRAKFRPNLYHRIAPDTPTMPQNPEQPSSPVIESPTSINYPQSESAHPLNKTTGPHDVLQTENTGRFTVNNRFKRFQPKVGGRRMFAGRNKPRRLPRQKELTNLTDPSDGNVGLTDVKEVWFSGCHSDVGGGAVANATKHCLSDIPLRWMVREVASAQCGLQFDTAALARAGIPNNVFSHESFRLRCSGSSAGTADKRFSPLFVPQEFTREPKAHSQEDGTEVKDEAGSTASSDPNADSGGLDAANDDALQPIHDELQLNKAWWLLEIVPTDYSWQDGKGVWHTKWGFHCGRGRKIPDDFNPMFHESVKHRMAYAPLKYTPRAVWKTGTESYVS